MNQRGLTERELNDRVAFDGDGWSADQLDAGTRWDPGAVGDDPRRDAARAEVLARIGVAVGAQRTEVFEVTGDGARMSLVGWWTAFGHAPRREPDPDRPVPLEWFPWSLGNIRPTDYVFVRNAGPLPLQPDSSMRIRDLSMGSSLHLPVRDGLRLVGGICAYWSEERDGWDGEATWKVHELGLSMLR